MSRVFRKSIDNPPIGCKGMEWSFWDLYDRVFTLAFFKTTW